MAFSSSVRESDNTNVMQEVPYREKGYTILAGRDIRKIVYCLNGKNVYNLTQKPVEARHFQMAYHGIKCSG